MKSTKQLVTLTLGLALTLGGSLGAVDQSTKMKLMEEAMIETATTPAQKALVSSYMQSVAQEKIEIAKNLRERADRPKAGKVTYKNAERRELIQKAEALEAEAKRYSNF